MWETLKNWAVNQGANLASRVLFAVILAVIGILICRIIMKIVHKALERSKLEKAAHSLHDLDSFLNGGLRYRNRLSPSLNFCSPLMRKDWAVIFFR